MEFGEIFIEPNRGWAVRLVSHRDHAVLRIVVDHPGDIIGIIGVHQGTHLPGLGVVAVDGLGFPANIGGDKERAVVSIESQRRPPRLTIVEGGELLPLAAGGFAIIDRTGTFLIVDPEARHPRPVNDPLVHPAGIAGVQLKFSGLDRVVIHIGLGDLGLGGLHHVVLQVAMDGPKRGQAAHGNDVFGMAAISIHRVKADLLLAVLVHEEKDPAVIGPEETGDIVLLHGSELGFPHILQIHHDEVHALFPRLQGREIAAVGGEAQLADFRQPEEVGHGDHRGRAGGARRRAEDREQAQQEQEDNSYGHGKKSGPAGVTSRPGI